MGITIGGVSTPQLDLTLDTAVTLSTTDSGSSYLWEVLDKPNGSTATLSSTSIKSPSFTPDKVGSYLFKLTISSVTQEYGLIAVRSAKSSLRFPAAGEGGVNTGGSTAGARSWATDVNAGLKHLDEYTNKGIVITAYNGTGSAIAKGKVVNLSSPPLVSSATTLASGVAAGATTLVLSGTGAPFSFSSYVTPFKAVLNVGNLSDQEEVVVSSFVGTTMTLASGTKNAHPGGATVQYSSFEFNSLYGDSTKEFELLPKMELASATTSAVEYPAKVTTIGVVVGDLSGGSSVADGKVGLVMMAGVLKTGIDFTSFSLGQFLFAANAAGTITNNAQSADAPHTIGRVLSADTNGYMLVQNGGPVGGNALSVGAVSSTPTTLTPGQCQNSYIVVDSSSGTITLNTPAATAYGSALHAGKTLTVFNAGSNNVVLTGGSGVTLNGAATQTITPGTAHTYIFIPGTGYLGVSKY